MNATHFFIASVNVRYWPSMKYLAIISLGLAIASAAFGQEGYWKDAKGNPAPETEARRSLNGLGGSLLVTSDVDWREKWDTPSNTVPHFNEAKTVAKGKQVFVLTFFANPKLTADGRANLTCDLDVIRPDGTTSIHQTDIVCFQGILKGSPYNMYLSAPVLGFTGEVSDPAGTWTVRVSLKDNLRNSVLRLKTSFILK
ncbi:hypothetical protein [Pseudoduganella aquatica]|uniref:Uncharacterized protein n=1 Tax=Pseudoduganella aquatica TaxID=2660641 RepID=A0A7X4HFP0_9BURK|nr:hypothetical protein [Pseudoduganella aquatica]MYN09923.1 hypothetical protein [Pseudoduganella aquatica]